MWQGPNNPIYQSVIVVWLTLSLASAILAAVTWFDLARKLRDANEAVAIRDESDTSMPGLDGFETLAEMSKIEEFTLHALGSGPSPEPLGKLRRLLACERPSVRSSLAFDESKDFAVKLHQLGQRWDCPALARFAQALTQYAESYSVVELEKHLAGFPTLVERLERSIAA